MALMGLARAGDVFTAAAAGAPVTHWDGYGMDGASRVSVWCH